MNFQNPTTSNGGGFHGLWTLHKPLEGLAIPENALGQRHILYPEPYLSLLGHGCVNKSVFENIKSLIILIEWDKELNVRIMRNK